MRKIIIFAIKSLLMLGLFFPTSSPQAATVTFYVDKTNLACDDFGAGTTPSQPFCTITMGASVAVQGNTVRVLAGTYAEKVKPVNNGSIGNPITFSAAPGVTVTGDGSESGSAFRLTGFSYITIDGFTVTHTSDHGIYVSGSDHITISNNRVSYAGNTVVGMERCGIYLTGTTDSTITRNITDHNSLDGIRLIKSSLRNTVSNNVSFANASGNSRSAEGIDVENNSTSNTIIHNIVYANEDSGLNFYAGALGGSGSNLIIGNVSYGNGDHGIDSNDSPNNVIIGNTVDGNVTSGINLEGFVSPGPGSSGATVINNIMVNNGYCRLVDGTTFLGKVGNISVDALSIIGTTLDYNLYYLYSAGTQVAWGGFAYSSLAAFNSLYPEQEIKGLLGNPLFAAPAPIAMRPVAAPFNMAVNLGNYYILAGSPAIDSANSSAPGEPFYDIVGRPRLDDPSVENSGYGARTFDDRGAYEFIDFMVWYKTMLPLIMR